eukprot:COSAG01_NODE_1966_length_8778_cov_41.983176_11_plen_110_part_00
MICQLSGVAFLSAERDPWPRAGVHHRAVRVLPHRHARSTDKKNRKTVSSHRVWGARRLHDLEQLAGVATVQSLKVSTRARIATLIMGIAIAVEVVPEPDDDSVIRTRQS